MTREVTGRHDDLPADVRPRPSQEVRRRRYLWLMGTCVALFVLSGTLLREVSAPLAVATAVVAALIPPVASVVANWGAGRTVRGSGAAPRGPH